MEYGADGWIKESRYFLYQPMKMKFELLYTRQYQYIGSDVIEREIRQDHGKETVVTMRTFSLNQKKQLKTLLIEKPKTNSTQLVMDKRFDMDYIKDTLRVIREFRNSTTIYKANQ